MPNVDRSLSPSRALGHRLRVAAGLGAAASLAAGLLTVSAPANAADVIFTLPTGVATYAVAFSPDGSHAYVPNFNSNTVSVIDTAGHPGSAASADTGSDAGSDSQSAYAMDNPGTSGSVSGSGSTSGSVYGSDSGSLGSAPFVVANIVTGVNPVGVAVTPDGAHAYVTNSKGEGGGGTVSVIDTATNTAGTLGLEYLKGPAAVAVSPDGRRAYITNSEGNFVTVVDTRTNQKITNVTVGQNPFGVAVSPDSTRVYVTSKNTNELAVIDTATNEVISTVSVGKAPYGVAVAPNGNQVYVTNTTDNTMTVVDTTDNANRNIATIPVGQFPTGVAVDPDGARVYVTNQAENRVAAVDMARGGVAQWIRTGGGPYGIAITPDGTRAYVSNYTTSNVSIMKIEAQSTIEGTPPNGRVGDPYYFAFNLGGRPIPTTTISAGGLPEGMYLTQGGILKGTPKVDGHFEATVTAFNGVGWAQDQKIAFDIEPGVYPGGSVEMSDQFNQFFGL